MWPPLLNIFPWFFHGGPVTPSSSFAHMGIWIKDRKERTFENIDHSRRTALGGGGLLVTQWLFSQLDSLWPNPLNLFSPFHRSDTFSLVSFLFWAVSIFLGSHFLQEWMWIGIYPYIAVYQNKYTGPFGFKGFVGVTMGKQKGIQKINNMKELWSLQKPYICVQLYPYPVPRWVDGCFSAPEGGALIRAPPFSTSSLPYLFPQTRASFPEGLSFQMCKYSRMSTCSRSGTSLCGDEVALKTWYLCCNVKTLKT